MACVDFLFFVSTCVISGVADRAFNKGISTSLSTAPVSILLLRLDRRATGLQPLGALRRLTVQPERITTGRAKAQQGKKGGEEEEERRRRSENKIIGTPPPPPTTIMILYERWIIMMMILSLYNKYDNTL